MSSGRAETGCSPSSKVHIVGALLAACMTGVMLTCMLPERALFDVFF